MKVANIDKANFILIIASFCAAYLIPYELLLFSYAFLGPLHYLTEISWLHDRKYFTISQYDPIYLTVISLITVLGMFFVSSVVQSVWLLLCLAFSAAFVKSNKLRLLIMGSGLLFSVLIFGTTLSYALSILMTTVIHVYIFTLLFMLSGALKSGSHWGFLNTALFFMGGLILLIIPQSEINLFPEYVGKYYVFFESIAKAFASLLSISVERTLPAIASFLAFAYTYHYLNWFSKTSVIAWHHISKYRALAIGFLYIISVGLYLYDYAVGFVALLILSFIHVVLEFPLNFKSIQSIYQNLKK